MKKRGARWYFYLGVLLIIIAYFLNITKFIPILPLGLALPNILFLVGMWLFFDYFDFELNKDSILHKIVKKPIIILYLFFIGLGLGIIFELYGVLISNLWYSYFQSWNFLSWFFHYFLGIFWGYALSFLMFIAIYRTIVGIIKKITHKKLSKKVKWDKVLMNILFVIGIIFLMVPFILWKFSINWHPILRGFIFAFFLIGLWFIFEFAEYERHKQGVLIKVLHGYFAPFIALAIEAVIISISWENLGFLRPSYIYQNILFENIKLLGIPIQIVLGWIPLIIIYISAYNLIFKEKMF